MKLSMALLLGSALTGLATPVLAQVAPASPQQYQTDQDRDRERNTQAYNDGYTQGQADARSHAGRNDQATAQWTKDDDQRAYRQGYDAGYENIMNGGMSAREPVAPAARMEHGDNQAQQFGYQDGVAAGRQDAMKGNKFKPEDHDLYKSGTHGWAAELGTKDEFKQLYRQAFIKGYEDGYKGSGLH